MDLKLIFLIVAAFFIQEVKKQIHLCVIVNFLNDDTLAIEYNYNNTFDHINITSDEFDNFKIRGYKYKDVVPFFMKEKRLVNGTFRDYGSLRTNKETGTVRIFQKQTSLSINVITIKLLSG